MLDEANFSHRGESVQEQSQTQSGGQVGKASNTQEPKEKGKIKIGVKEVKRSLHYAASLLGEKRMEDALLWIDNAQKLADIMSGKSMSPHELASAIQGNVTETKIEIDIRLYSECISFFNQISYILDNPDLIKSKDINKELVGLKQRIIETYNNILEERNNRSNVVNMHQTWGKSKAA